MRSLVSMLSVVVLASCSSKNDSQTPALLSCQEVLSCASDCVGTGCEDTCVGRGSTVAQAQIRGLLDCVAAAGCSTDDGTCIQTKCAAQVSACTGSAVGTLSCADVLGCAASCSTEACLSACVNQSTSDALQQLGALVQCNTSAGCDSDSSCLQAACGAEVTACIGELPDGGTIDVPPILPPMNPDLGGGPTDDAGTTDAFPVRFVGTVHEHSELAGNVRDALVTVTFERDDNSDYTCPASQWAVYKALPYTVAMTESLNNVCTYQSSGTFTAAAPETWENKICIRKILENDGSRVYDIGIHANFVKAGGVVTMCPGPTSSTSDWKPFVAVAGGLPTPTVTDLSTLKHSVAAPYQPGRLWEWDLTGQF